MLNEFDDELTSSKIHSALRSPSINSTPLNLSTLPPPTSSTAPINISPRSSPRANVSPRAHSPKATSSTLSSPRAPITKSISVYGSSPVSPHAVRNLNNSAGSVSSSSSSSSSSSASTSIQTAAAFKRGHQKSISSSNLKIVISQTSPTVPRTPTEASTRLGGNLKELKRERSTSVKDIRNRFEELIKSGLLEQDQKQEQQQQHHHPHSHKAVKSSSSSSIASPLPERRTLIEPMPVAGSTSAKISVPALSLSLIPDRAREVLTLSGSQSAKESSKHLLSPRKFKSTPQGSQAEPGDLVFEMDDDMDGSGKSGKGDKKEKKHKHKRKNSTGSIGRVTKDDSGGASANIPRSTPRDVISPRHHSRTKEEGDDDDHKKDKKKHKKHKRKDSQQSPVESPPNERSPRQKLETRHKKPPPVPPSLESLPERPSQEDLQVLIKINTAMKEGSMSLPLPESPAPSIPPKPIYLRASLNLDLRTVNSQRDDSPMRPSPRTLGILKDMKNKLHIFEKAGLSPRGRSASVSSAPPIDIPEKPANLFVEAEHSSVFHRTSEGGRQRSASVAGTSAISGPMGLPFEEDIKLSKKNLLGGELSLNRASKSSSKEKGMGLAKHSSSDELISSPGKKCIRSDYDAGLDAWPSKTIAFDEWPETEATPKLIDLNCKKLHFYIEAGRKGTQMATRPEALAILAMDNDHAFYADKLNLVDHNNYFGEDEAVGPVIISLETPHGERAYCRALVRTKQNDERVVVPVVSKKDKIKAITAANPKLANIKFIKSNDPELIQELLKMERQALTKKFKFGVLYCKDGQTIEDDMFNNEHGSADFNEFLEFLGDRIILEGWKLFRGGLDVKTNTTGRESIYAAFRGYEIMFHCSTLLPYTPGDAQQLERKRHLGNDIVIIVFKEGDQPLDPTVFRSHFIHIWVVISKLPPSEDGKVRYRMEVVSKAGMKTHRPYLPEEPIFEKNTEFRNFLLTKLMNSERAALMSQEFKTKSVRTRATVLHSLVETASKKKKR